MKKRYGIFIIVLLCCAFLTACGSGKYGNITAVSVGGYELELPIRAKLSPKEKKIDGGCIFCLEDGFDKVHEKAEKALSEKGAEAEVHKKENGEPCLYIRTESEDGTAEEYFLGVIGEKDDKYKYVFNGMRARLCTDENGGEYIWTAFPYHLLDKYPEREEGQSGVNAVIFFDREYKTVYEHLEECTAAFCDYYEATGRCETSRDGASLIIHDKNAEPGAADITISFTESSDGVFLKFER